VAVVVASARQLQNLRLRPYLRLPLL